MLKFHLKALSLVALLITSVARADTATTLPDPSDQIVITPDKPDGIYEVGQPIHWHVQWKGDGPVPPLKYEIKKGGRTEIASGDLTFAGNDSEIDAKLDEPNTILAVVSGTSSE